MGPEPRMSKRFVTFCCFWLVALLLRGQTEVELVGKPAANYPHFRWVQNVNADQSVFIAIDGRLHPALANVTADVYVVADRSASEWQQNPILTDVTNGGARSCLFGSDSIQQNIYELALPNEVVALNPTGIGVGYDVVIDVDGNGALSVGDFIDGGEGAGFYAVHDLTQQGGLAVTVRDWTANYSLTRRIWYPTDIANMDALPLLMISHGWTYNYTYYDHLGAYLASYGYIVVSHRNAVGFGDEAGTNTAALSLIANVTHLLENQDTLIGGVLNGKIDHHHMGWMGHSTGGESPVRAYTRLHNGESQSNAFDWTNVQYISSICPVAWYSDTFVDPMEVNYHQFLGGADTDASGDPVDTYTQPLSIYERGQGNKSVIYFHGAGHAVFHNHPASNPLASGPDLITRTQLHPFLQAYTLALSELYCRQNPAGKEFFTRSFADYHPMNTSDSVVISNEYREGQATHKQVLDDFQTQSSLGLASSGAAVTSDLVNAEEVLMRDMDTSFAYLPNQPGNGMSRSRYTDDPHCLVMEWDSSRAIRYAIPDSLKDFSGYEFLSLRACQRTHHPLNVALDSSVTFVVRLVDEDGDSASISVADYGPIVRTYQRDGGWQNEFCTVRMRLRGFLVNGTMVDLDRIASLVLDFGGAACSAMGALGIDDIELVDGRLSWPTAVEDRGSWVNESLLLYPNPTSGRFRVRFPQVILEGRLEVLSMVGQRVYGAEIVGVDEMEIGLEGVARGMYWVVVEAGGQRYFGRVGVE